MGRNCKHEVNSKENHKTQNSDNTTSRNAGE